MYAGIDPGKTGAIAVIDAQGAIYKVIDYPEDFTELRNLFNSNVIKKAALEKVSAMPGQGVTSMFKFGCNVGRWEGMLYQAGIPFEYVTPGKWQKIFDSSTKGDTKQMSLNLARRLFPNEPLARKKDNGRADAILMAEWLRRKELGLGI